MQVSSSTSSNMNSTQTLSADPQKKAMQVQERQVQQILDSAQQQSQQMTAQKTGVGGNLNITA
jgi:hypothetical protein